MASPHPPGTNGYGSPYTAAASTYVPGPPTSAPPGGTADKYHSSNADSPTYRTYNNGSAPSLPLRQKPGPPLPPSQIVGYPPSSPPPMMQLPPQPTMSTQGSVVGITSNGGGTGGMPMMSGAISGGPPRPSSGPPMSYVQAPMTQSPGPMANTTVTRGDLRTARVSAEAALEQFILLKRQQQEYLQYGPGAADVRNSTAAQVQERLRMQTGVVLSELRSVRRAVSAMTKAAENHRFRRWIVGGLLAGFIPLVRRLFRRPGRSSSSNSGGAIVASNDTEYAFARSRTIVDRMLDSVRGRGGLASVAFFVFAVLYVFSNEVSLRVSRTVVRRLKRLSSRIERGDEDISEADLKLLNGWRWRVLLWGRR